MFASQFTLKKIKYFNVRAVIISFMLLLTISCAKRPLETDHEARLIYNEANDPLEPMNRQIFLLNTIFDEVALEPAARLYRMWGPPDIRDGTFIFPEKFNANVLENIKANTRSSFFSSQYYNQPISEENQTFKHENFQYYEKHPEGLTIHLH